MPRQLAAIAALALLYCVAHASDPAILGEWGLRYNSGGILDVNRCTFAEDGTYTGTYQRTGSLDAMFAASFPGTELPTALGDGVYAYAIEGTWQTAGSLFSCTAVVTQVTVNGMALTEFIAGVIEATVAQQAQAGGLSTGQAEALRGLLGEQFEPLALMIPTLIQTGHTIDKAPFTVDDEMLFILTDPQAERGMLYFRDLTRTGVSSVSWGSVKALVR
ncbi:MAG: hypothetical protein AB1505_21655 [Candidatus Latescibacterota bacterium]